MVFRETLTYLKFLVVDSSTADPGITGVTPIPCDRKHVDICKFESRQTAQDRYLSILTFFRKCLSSTPRKSSVILTAMPGVWAVVAWCITLYTGKRLD